MDKIKLKKLVEKAHGSAWKLAVLSTSEKNRILDLMAQALEKNQAAILKANIKDMKAAEKKKLSPAMKDRLLLNEKRIKDMAQGLLEVRDLPDPVGHVIKEYERPNGLKIKKVRIPLGTLAVVYESRPNVTVDAAGLCFKSGNVVILRGGSEAIFSNTILGKILQDVLKKEGLPPEFITVIPTTDRKALVDLIQLSGLIDVVIPRGGEGLMKFMEEHSKIPIIKHDKGVCNLFVDESADLNQTIPIILNSKVQRPGVCNALENLFIHEKVAPSFLPSIATALMEAGVELRGDIKARKLVPQMKKALESDWSTEYLDLILSVRVVKDMKEAMDLIRRYGSGHTEAILTNNLAHGEEFVRGLDSSCVMVNASTRFNDGGQLGLGAEIGISTTKLHAYGPMGLEELTSAKYVVLGQGQVRQ